MRLYNCSVIRTKARKTIPFFYYCVVLVLGIDSEREVRFCLVFNFTELTHFSNMPQAFDDRTIVIKGIRSFLYIFCFRAWESNRNAQVFPNHRTSTISNFTHINFDKTFFCLCKKKQQKSQSIETKNTPLEWQNELHYIRIIGFNNSQELCSFF